MKVVLSEIKKIYTEPIVEGMKPRIKSMIWDTRKEKVFNQKSRKRKEFLKNQDRLRNLWDISKYANI